jgi:hypothetical protein
MTWTTVTLKVDGAIEADNRMCPKGQQASGWRNLLKNATDEDIQRYLDSRCDGAILKGWFVEGIDIYGSELELRCSFEVADYASCAEDMLILKPALYSEPSLCRSFASKERRYPVAMPAMTTRVDSLIMVIPDGYEVLNLPEPVHLSGPLGEFDMNMTLKGNRLLCYRCFEIDELVCGKNDYPDLKQFLADVRTCCGKSIVIKKLAGESE